MCCLPSELVRTAIPRLFHDCSDEKQHVSEGRKYKIIVTKTGCEILPNPVELWDAFCNWQSANSAVIMKAPPPPPHRDLQFSMFCPKRMYIQWKTARRKQIKRWPSQKTVITIYHLAASTLIHLSRSPPLPEVLTLSNVCTHTHTYTHIRVTSTYTHTHVPPHSRPRPLPPPEAPPSIVSVITFFNCSPSHLVQLHMYPSSCRDDSTSVFGWNACAKACCRFSLYNWPLHSTIGSQRMCWPYRFDTNLLP